MANRLAQWQAIRMDCRQERCPASCHASKKACQPAGSTSIAFKHDNKLSEKQPVKSESLLTLHKAGKQAFMTVGLPEGWLVMMLSSKPHSKLSGKIASQPYGKPDGFGYGLAGQEGEIPILLL